MSIHKTCYRCARPVRELENPADLLGGLWGVCTDCHLTIGAREVARKWHAMHPEFNHAGVPDIPHEISPAHSEPDQPNQNETTQP